MDSELLVVFARSVVGVALIASAIWKLRHRREFLRVFGTAPKVVRRVAELPGLVPLVELVAGGLALVPSTVGRFGALASLLLVALFTAVSLIFGAGGSCGCWAEPQGGSSQRVQQRAMLLRNLTLMVAAGSGTATQGSLPSAQAAFAVAVGMLAAFIVLEIPQIAATATYVQSLEVADHR